jgi:hypothetical protein
MTTIPALLANLRRRNIRVSVEPGDRLRLEGPAEALTPEVRSEITAHREAILETLRATRRNGEPVHVISVTPLVPQLENPPTQDAWRRRLHAARDWSGLFLVINDAQEAFVDGTLGGLEVEDIGREANVLSQSLPEHTPEAES